MATVNSKLILKPGMNVERWKSSFLPAMQAKYGACAEMILAGVRPTFEAQKIIDKYSIDGNRPDSGSLEYSLMVEECKENISRKLQFCEDEKKFFADILIHQDPDSLAALRREADMYERLRVGNDTLGLFDLIDVVHNQDGRRSTFLDKRQKRLDVENFRQQPGSTLSEHTQEFEDKLKSSKTVGVKWIDKDLVVTYLFSLDPKYIDIVEKLFENADSDDENIFPQTFESAKRLIREKDSNRKRVRGEFGVEMSSQVVNVKHEGLAKTMRTDRNNSDGSSNEFVECLWCKKTHRFGAQKCFDLIAWMKDNQGYYQKALEWCRTRSRGKPTSNQVGKNGSKQNNASGQQGGKAHVTQAAEKPGKNSAKNKKKRDKFKALVAAIQPSTDDLNDFLMKTMKVSVGVVPIGTDKLFNSYAIDSCANCSVIGNRSLVWNIRSCKPVKIEGLGNVTVNHVADSIFGKVFYMEGWNMNIIAYQDCIGCFNVRYDSAEDDTTFYLNGEAGFVRGAHNLYWLYHDDLINNPKMLGNRMVKVGRRSKFQARQFDAPATPYTSEQQKRAREVKIIHDAMHHPGDDALAHLFDTVAIDGVKYNARDVAVMRDIYKECRGCAKGKTKRPSQKPSDSEPSSRVGHKLHCDIFFIKCTAKNGNPLRIPFMLAVDDFSNELVTHRLQNRSLREVEEAFEAIVLYYRSWGWDVKKILVDRESSLIAAEKFLNEKSIVLEKTSTDQHVVRAERYITEIKAKFRATIHSLNFKLPQFLYPRLIKDIITMINVCPNHRTVRLSPFYLTRGARPVARKNTFIPFGNICEFNVPGMPDGNRDDKERTETGVVVGREWENGSYEVLLLHNLEFVNRKHVHKVLPSTHMLREIESLWTPDQPADVEQIIGRERGPLSRRKRKQRGDTTLPDDITNTTSTEEEEVTPDEPPPLVEDESDDERDVEELEEEMVQQELEQPLPVTTLTSEDVREYLRSPEREMEQEEPPSEPARHVRRSGRTPKARNLDYTCVQKPTEGFTMPTDPSCMFTARTDIAERRPEDKKAADIKEIKQLLDLEVFEPVHSLNRDNKHQNILSSNIFSVEKFNSVTGAFERVKSRFVTHGNFTDPELYGAMDKSLPTVSIETLFMVINEGTFEQRKFCAIDVPGAYLHATLDDPHTVRIPRKVTEVIIHLRPEWKGFVKPDGTMLVELRKALYGLPESSKQWYDEFKSTLLGLGYKCHPTEPCLFVKRVGVKKCTLCLHVDDIFCSYTHFTLRKELCDIIEQKYGTPKVDDGDFIAYLGMSISQPSSEGITTVNQPSFVDKLLESVEIEGVVKTPATDNILAIRLDSEKVNNTEYLSLLMKLMYLAKRTRPDLLFSLSFLSTRASSPNLDDWNKLCRVVKYIRGTREYGLTFKPTSMRLMCWIDASYGIHEDRRGHTGIVICMGTHNAPIHVRSCKQKSVARSSTESELLGLDNGISILKWIRIIHEFLGHRANPVIIYQDNMSTLTVAEAGMTKNGRIRHLAIIFEAIKEQIDDGDIKLVYKKTEEMLADILTKPKQGTHFERLRAELLNILC